uniref:IQ motif containing K n=1 Tax=Rousettus aegyptiacus TaxID=9407 RepID=A0A7J8EZ88_ROUAE|nr:IQ motif containing K [Rousettus aegyptiacus]
MAAPQYVGSRTGQSEERAGSIESFVTSRRTLPAVSHVSFERPVSPGQVAEPPGKSMWEQICEEYEAELPTFPEVYKAKPEAVISVSPLEGTFFHGFNAEHLYSIPHLAKDSHITCTHVKSETADPETCSPKEYLETFIFPILLPGMASLLHQAKKEKCFETSGVNSLILTSGFSSRHFALFVSLCIRPPVRPSVLPSDLVFLDACQTPSR